MPEATATLLAAFLGALAAGLIGSHLALVQERRFAANTLMIRLTATVDALGRRLRVSNGAPPTLEDWTYTEIPREVLHADWRIAQSLPAHVTMVVMHAEAATLDLRSAINEAKATQLRLEAGGVDRAEREKLEAKWRTHTLHQAEMAIEFATAAHARLDRYLKQVEPFGPDPQ